MQLLCGLWWEFNCPSQPLHCISFLCAYICMTDIYSLNFTVKKLSVFNLCLSQFGTQWGRLIQVIARVSNSFAFINYVAINCRPCLRVVVFILSLTETGCLPPDSACGWPVGGRPIFTFVWLRPKSPILFYTNVIYVFIIYLPYCDNTIRLLTCLHCWSCFLLHLSPLPLVYLFNTHIWTHTHTLDTLQSHFTRLLGFISVFTCHDISACQLFESQ